MNAESYYLRLLKERFSEKQRKNVSYSLRAFARDLDLHPATLSQVFKGNRPLPTKNIKAMVSKLGLSPKESTLFIESIHLKKSKIDTIRVNPLEERIMLDESHFKVIAEWEHYAILTLFDVRKFNPSPQEISDRLNLPRNRIELALNNLVTSGLLSKSAKGAYKKSIPAVRTTEDITSRALQNSHRETLEMGLKKLDQIEVELRDYSSSTLAIDLTKISEAKTIIREFRQKMAALLKDGNRTDVYQLAIQFYPLTQIKKEGIRS